MAPWWVYLPGYMPPWAPWWVYTPGYMPPYVHPGRYTRPYMPVCTPCTSIRHAAGIRGGDTFSPRVEERRPPEEQKRPFSP